MHSSVSCNANTDCLTAHMDDGWSQSFVKCTRMVLDTKQRAHLSRLMAGILSLIERDMVAIYRDIVVMMLMMLVMMLMMVDDVDDVDRATTKIQ